jgi:hypothetical protein
MAKSEKSKIELAATPLAQTNTPISQAPIVVPTAPAVEAKSTEFTDENGEVIKTIDQNIPAKDLRKVVDNVWVEFRTNNGDLLTGQRSKVIQMGYEKNITKIIKE